MSWWDQLLSKETRGRHHQNSDAEALEIEARQPFSDGTEEFLEKFMPHDDHGWRPNKQVLIGLGITAGVVAGVGIAVWLKKGKRRKSWRDLLAKS